MFINALRYSAIVDIQRVDGLNIPGAVALGGKVFRFYGTAAKTVKLIAKRIWGLCQVIDAPKLYAWPSFMISKVSQPRLKGFRFPRSIISCAVWAYHRFALSLRDVEDLLTERGVIVSYESIRVWCQRVGRQIAAKIHHNRQVPADKWHLDEVVIQFVGENIGFGERSTPTETCWRS